MLLSVIVPPPSLKPSLSDFEEHPNKHQNLRPQQLKQTVGVVFFRIRQIYDSGEPGSNNMDVPKRFIPALVSGLAYYIAMKKPESAERLPFLKQEYEEQWRLASEEDRVKAAFRFVPWTGYT